MTITHEPEKKQDLETAWSRGIEKMLAASPARDLRTADDENRTDSYLQGLLKDGEGCGTHTWSEVHGHSAHPGHYTSSVRTDYCNGRGCPNCRDRLAKRQLAKHEHRFALAYELGEGFRVRLRMADGEETGFGDLKKLTGRWERRRTVKPLLEPMFGCYGLDEDGTYGLTLIAPDMDRALQVGESWAAGVGGTFVVSLIGEDVLQAATELKVETEAAAFEAVDGGLITAEFARQMLIEERGRKRTKFLGGFLELAIDAGAEAFEVEGDELEWDDRPPKAPAHESDLPEDEHPQDVSRPEHRLWVDAFATIPDATVTWTPELESMLRSIRAGAKKAGDSELVDAIDTQLERIPDEHFDCPFHRRCRLVPTGQRIKTRYIKQAAEDGNADQLDNGRYEWTDWSWPRWQRLAQPITREER